MNGPVLDPRSLEDLRRQTARLARAYTPEWRYERPEDDPGAALAELFCTMFHQTIDRFNALPAKLYLEFLNQIGFQELPPVPARGTMVFTPRDTVEQPVTVPACTRVFTPDERGENIVYETQWTIQATPAQLLEIYFTDGEKDQICRLELSRPVPFFSPAGEQLQCHRMQLGQQHVLQLDCPCRLTLEVPDEAGQPDQETLRALAEGELRWSYLHGGTQVPFEQVFWENGRLTLEKDSALSLEPDGEGHLALTCEGTPARELVLDQVLLRSEPLQPCPAQSLFSGDTPILPEEGGYCFGRRPAPYALFYLRSDTALSKRGARVNLELDLAPVVEDPSQEQPVLQYNQHIIDKRGAVRAKPDDTYVSGVTWEYFNGLGWRRLEVTGDKNPFSCQQEKALNTIFEVPEDLESTEVNAERGWYIRARVTDVENQFSQLQRWVLPFVKGASFQWQYETGLRPDWVCGENHCERTAIDGADRYEHLGLRALSPMEPGPQAMYFRFDRSPHAAPLSLRFQIFGGGELHDQPQWEWWNGRQFTPVRCLDQTGRLGRSGAMQLFLPKPLPQACFFGRQGCWLRLSRTSVRPGPVPVVGGICLNAVTAVQRQREPEQYFDTGVYEACKRVQLLTTPMQDCQVWVDEKSSISDGELEQLLRQQPNRVEVIRDGQQLTRCWVRWQLISNLALAGEGERVCQLDPYEGVIRFGDGRQGRVPPAGDQSIRVRYASGGGVRGNLPAGAVTALLEGLPFIAQVTNLTPMSGGTGRMSQEEIERRGNRILRTRGRAAGRRDYEDLVYEAFPQVRHVRCFSGTDGAGRRAPGHVAVVLSGFGSPEEGEQLCDQVREHLSQRCSCCLVREGRLHVCPAAVLTVNTQVTVTVERPELAADTQQEIARRLTQLIEQVWKSRSIGSQIRLDEVWQTVRQVPNVRTTDQILVEARYRQGGVDRLVPLEADGEFPFSVVENGLHQVRVR